MVPPVNLLAVATAVPPHRLEQRAIADAARQVYGRTFARFPKLADVFTNAGIESRYSARPLEWLCAPHDLAERTDAYVESASELFITTARGARACGNIAARRRRSGDSIVNRNSNAQPRGARRPRNGVSAVDHAGPGFWSRMCRRRFRPHPRCAACARRTRRGRSCGRGRTVHADLAHRSRH